MHQTTIRFGSDLWDALEAECRELGVSIAQYLREAAIARVAYTEATRRRSAYGAALEEAQEARAHGLRATDSSLAVLAQSKLARERARQLRLASESARSRHLSDAASRGWTHADNAVFGAVHEHPDRRRAKPVGGET
jgi:hypothetical protein